MRGNMGPEHYECTDMMNQIKKEKRPDLYLSDYKPTAPPS